MYHNAQYSLSDAFVWRLSVACIGNNSRIERPRKTKICQTGSQRYKWLGHHFQGQRSKVNLHVNDIVFVSDM